MCYLSKRNEIERTYFTVLSETQICNPFQHFKLKPEEGE